MAEVLADVWKQEDGRWVWRCELCGSKCRNTWPVSSLAFAAVEKHETSDKHRMNEVHEDRSARRG